MKTFIFRPHQQNRNQQFIWNAFDFLSQIETTNFTPHPSMIHPTIYVYVSMYLIYLALLHRPMIISEVLYNIHLCQTCECFIPVWGGATPAQIKSLGSIQVTWQLYSAHQPMETTQCFCICLITHTYNTIHTYNTTEIRQKKYGGWACSDGPHSPAF